MKSNDDQMHAQLRRLADIVDQFLKRRASIGDLRQELRRAQEVIDKAEKTVDPPPE